MADLHEIFVTMNEHAQPHVFFRVFMNFKSNNSTYSYLQYVLHIMFFCMSCFRNTLIRIAFSFAMILHEHYTYLYKPLTYLGQTTVCCLPI